MKIFTFILTGLLAVVLTESGMASREAGKGGASKAGPKKIIVKNKSKPTIKGSSTDLAKLRQLILRDSVEAPGELAAIERKNRFDEANRVAEQLLKMTSPEDSARLKVLRDNVAGYCTSPKSPVELTFWNSATCGEKLRAYELSIAAAQGGQPVPDAAELVNPAEAQLTDLKSENLKKLATVEEQQKKIIEDPRLTQSGEKFDSLVKVVTAALNSCKPPSEQDATDYVATPGCKEALDKALEAQINFRTGR